MKGYRLALVAALLGGCTVGTLNVTDPALVTTTTASATTDAGITPPPQAMTPTLASTPIPTPTGRPIAGGPGGPIDKPVVASPVAGLPAGLHAGAVDAKMGGAGIVTGTIAGPGYASVVVNIARADTGEVVAKAPGYSLGGGVFEYAAYGLAPGKYTAIPTTHLATVTFDKGRIPVEVTENNYKAVAPVALHVCRSVNAVPAEGVTTPPPCAP